MTPSWYNRNMRKGSHHSLETKIKMSKTRKGVRSNAYSHGMRYTRFYRIYHGILTRCTNPKAINFYRYGAKGIECEWKTFEQFYDDMYRSYLKHINRYGEKQTTIDRIDSEGNYNKKNCRWATYVVQAHNTSKNHNITFNGKTMCLSEWSKQTGIKRTTIIMRLNAYGWEVDKALTKGIK